MSRAARGVTLACALLAGACAAPALEAQSAPLSLEGTRWVMGGPKSDAQMPRLEFTREGRVSGFTGCNSLSGSYRLEEDRLNVVAATTKRACLGGTGGEAEARLLAVLADQPRVRIEARRLVLTGKSGATFELVSQP